MEESVALSTDKYDDWLAQKKAEGLELVCYQSVANASLLRQDIVIRFITITDITKVLNDAGFTDKLYQFREELMSMSIKVVLLEFSRYATEMNYVRRETFTTETVNTAAFSDEKFMAYRYALRNRENDCVTAEQKEVLKNIREMKLVCARPCDLALF